MTLWQGWHDERVLSSVANVPNWIGDAAANSSMRNRRASSWVPPIQLPGPVCLQRGWQPHILRPMLFIASPPRCRPGRLLAFEDGLLVTRFHASAEVSSSCDVGWRRQLMVSGQPSHLYSVVSVGRSRGMATARRSGCWGTSGDVPLRWPASAPDRAR